jgi:hypothetical protein
LHKNFVLNKYDSWPRFAGLSPAVVPSAREEEEEEGGGLSWRAP